MWNWFKQAVAPPKSKNHGIYLNSLRAHGKSAYVTFWTTENVRSYGDSETVIYIARNDIVIGEIRVSDRGEVMKKVPKFDGGSIEVVDSEETEKLLLASSYTLPGKWYCRFMQNAVDWIAGDI